MALTRRSCITLGVKSLFLFAAVPLAGWAQNLQPDTSVLERAVAASTNDRNSCRIQRVTGLPGSHRFASDFIEAIATSPDRHDQNSETIWGLTADLSDQVPVQDRALYISKSSDDGATWTQVARVDSRYFDASIGEGLRNGLSVSPGGTYFVITTQRGAFQVFSQPGTSDALVKTIPGPRVPSSRPKVRIVKKAGDPLRANVVKMTSDGTHLLVGYGYFDLDPKIFSYHRDESGSWIEDGPLPPPPTQMDLLSMEFDDPGKADPGFLYLGTGDQAYLFNLHTRRWSRIDGVGPDSAIHGMSIVGGLHLAACWGVYNPSGPGTVRRVTRASFLLHRASDEAGPNLRAYSIEVDPLRPNREMVTSLTGVYTSADSGQTWRRFNGLPEEEFRSAHFNPDGTILVSGIAGTFLLNPFTHACSPHLTLHAK
jgi:hypothetical protein